jgi:hypothetical protein
MLLLKKQDRLLDPRNRIYLFLDLENVYLTTFAIYHRSKVIYYQWANQISKKIELKNL